MAGLVWARPQKEKRISWAKIGPTQPNSAWSGPVNWAGPGPTIYILKQNKKQKKFQKIPKILSKNL